MTTFALEGMPYIQLCDLLKRTGQCENGGHAKSVISEGLVTVDGQKETRKRRKLYPGQTVEFNGHTTLIESST